MNETRFSAYTSCIVLSAIIGASLIASCTIHTPIPAMTATPSLPGSTFVAVPSQPAVTPVPLVTISTPPSPPTPPPALSPDLRLLASIPVAAFDDAYGRTYRDLYALDWSPNGKCLVYGRQDGIWVIRAPAYEPALLVSIPEGWINDVRWSPDGQYLAFHGRQLLEEYGLEGEWIGVVRADGTGLKDLTTDGPFDPLRAMVINQWLDDHTLTIDQWQGSGAQSLWQVDIASGRATQLIGYGDRTIPIQAHGGSYDWSPTHEHIVINHLGYGHLVLVNVSQTSELWFSTLEDPPSEVFRGWSQDGQRFLYARWNADEERYDLWLWDVMREKGEMLLPHVYQAVLSPDGSQVAFLQQEDRPGQVPDRIKEEVHSGLWPPALTAGVLDLETGGVILYSPAGYKASEGPYYWNGELLWSPDGELVAYWGEEGDVWLVSADGTWRQRLTQGLEIIQVLWSPDGGKLALRSFDHAWIVEKPTQLSSYRTGKSLIQKSGISLIDKPPLSPV